MPEPLGGILIESYGLFDSDKKSFETMPERIALSLDESKRLRSTGLKAAQRLISSVYIPS